MHMTGTTPNLLSYDWRYDRNLLTTLLWLATKNGKEPLPTEEWHILNAVVNGVLDYTGSPRRKISVHDPEFSYGRLTQFEGTVLRHFEEEISRMPGKLTPMIDGAVRRLTTPRFHSPWADRPYTDCLLEFYYSDPGVGICEVVMHSTFRLEGRSSARDAQCFFERMPEPDKKEIVGIAQAMKPYIGESVTQVAQTHWW